MGDSAIRERQEKWESEHLATYAALSVNSKGRQKEEEKCNIRTDFQRDRDRILYSKAFRRLKHKTQVFISPEGDYFRTRLTHTLEVSQFSRSIARALRLNEDLAEAIALGHDLGHAPFGHAGESALDSLLFKHTGSERFRHNEQSLRVVDLLEEGRGLNLTYEVRDGILKHTKGRSNFSDKTEESFIPITAEGQIVRIADRMAYINHDMDDALRAGIIECSDIPVDACRLLGSTASDRIGHMIMDVVTTSLKQDKVSMSEAMTKTLDDLKDFLFEKVYSDQVRAKFEEVKAKRLVEGMFEYYVANPEKLPSGIHPKEDSICRKICDYIAGMSDSFAIRAYEDIFIPKVWEN